MESYGVYNAVLVMVMLYHIIVIGLRIYRFLGWFEDVFGLEKFVSICICLLGGISIKLRFGLKCLFAMEIKNRKELVLIPHLLSVVTLFRICFSIDTFCRSQNDYTNCP